MKYCRKCEMEIASGLNSCPLCGDGLQQLKKNAYEFDYPARIQGKRQFSLIKLVLFFILLINSYFVVIGIFQDFRWHWVTMIFGLTIYVTISLFLGLKIKRNIGPNVLLQVISISVIAMMLDYFLISPGGLSWSIEVALPLALMTGTSILTLLIILRPKMFSDVIGYQLFFGVIGLLMYIPTYFQFFHFRAIVLAANHYVLMTCIGLFVFADRRLIHELKKKFHY